jgi:nicotinamide mononucleotide transporter
MPSIIIEILAVTTALLYLFLAAKEDVKCWYAAIISSSLYFYIMLNANLIMEAYLQIFYIGMAIFGFFQWRKLYANNKPIKIKSWELKTHVYVIAAIIIISLLSGILLSKYTNAALPFLDAMTTFGALITTYMVAKKVLENWIYWFVIDSISIYIFVSRELFLTAGLFLVYLIIIIFGYISWKKTLQEQYE